MIDAKPCRNFIETSLLSFYHLASGKQKSEEAVVEVMKAVQTSIFPTLKNFW